MDTNSHYGHLSVRDGRNLRVAKFFGVAGGGMHPCIPYGGSAPGQGYIPKHHSRDSCITSYIPVPPKDKGTLLRLPMINSLLEYTS
jgi:hypothetical protein